jgi:hypothetical protein
MSDYAQCGSIVMALSFKISITTIERQLQTKIFAHGLLMFSIRNSTLLFNALPFSESLSEIGCVSPFLCQDKRSREIPFFL